MHAARQAAVRVFQAGVVLLSVAAAAQTQPQLSVTGVGQELRFNVTGDPAISYRVEVSSDLNHWYPMKTTYPSIGVFPSSSQFEVTDREFVFRGQTFYRAVAARSAPPPPTNAAPEIIVSDPLLTLYQGRSASFAVVLAKPPASPVTVTVNVNATDGSTNISVNGATSLVFESSNWNTPQTVTVTASKDMDFRDSLATLTLSSDNLAPGIVRVLAVDNDVDDEFVGPFASWKDLKRDFGAKGDGTADDTASLQTALNTLRPYSNHNAVLYFPSGTYRITQTLNLRRTPDSEPQYITLLGQDPAITAVRWDGPTNGVMVVYGAWYSKISRLTFDGAGKAKTAIAHEGPFSTHNEFSDMVFKDLSFGIEAGTPNGGGNAETAVERCRFVRCALAGISIQNFNSLDWFIWNTEFDDCGLGISNTYGAGNFHVYESLFQHSAQADMSIANTGYFSARNNTSIGSAAFFTSTAIASCGLITLQGNTVVNPSGVPLQLGNYGPVVLLDNWIEAYQGRAGNIEPSAGFFSLGNTFTVSNAIPTGFDGPAGIRLDNVVTSQQIPLTLPKLPGALPHLQRQIFDLPGPTNAAGIQAAIDRAAASAGSRPVVHLPSGDYLISDTITIPAGSDLQLVGDGGATAIHWTGTGQGPILRLAGPARATLRDFRLFGPATNSQVDGIVVDKCDQAGGKLYSDQLDVYRSTQVGVLVEGLTDATVTLQDFYHSENQVSLQVIGGSMAPDYRSQAGHVCVFGGGAAANGVTYDVSNGGKLLVRDVWYEAVPSTTSPRFMVCTNSGWFTLHGAQVAPAQSRTNIPVVEISNFVGRLSFISTQFTFTNSQVSVSGNGANTAVVLLATLTGSEPEFSASQAQMSLLQSFQTQDYQLFNPFADTGPNDANFLRQMLAQTRNSRPAPLAPLPSGVTDVRIHRVMVEAGRIGVRLTR
jgi:hypothetical protein